MSSKLLENKTAIVTGAAQGIGLGIATKFLEHGANVIIADLNAESLSNLEHDLVLHDGKFLLAQCDVTNQDEVNDLIDTVVTKFGSLDVMVNNAGIVRDATLRKMSFEEFQKVIQVNLESTWLGTKAASIVMRDQGQGSIINMSSISGKVGFIGQTNYSAAKAGIVGLTKAAAKEVGFKGVRVNCLLPGYIQTPLTESLSPGVAQQKVQEVPLGRPGEIHEVADAALFLASDMSSYISGIGLEVAGGRHI